MSVISPLLSASRVALEIEASDKKAVFEASAALLEASAGLSRKQIVDSLVSRERLGSTALGQGIAIPHGRVKGLREATAAFLRLRQGIPFDAPDHAPVTLVFVLLVPERATDVHLQILSELAQMFSDPVFRAQLSKAPDTQSVQQLIGGWQAHAPNME
jgi:PTS system nitrogen regulatory IIA component